MRLGILHDSEAQQRMHDREQQLAKERKRKLESPTVRTEEEQKKHDEEQSKSEKEVEKKKESKAPKVVIRPLSEGKAIELGANFFSEAFIFAVAAGLLVWDSWRSRAKESARRDDVAERLDLLEEAVHQLEVKHDPDLRELKEKLRRLPERQYRWYNPVGWFARREPDAVEDEEAPAVDVKAAKQEALKPAAGASGTPPTSASVVAEAKKSVDATAEAKVPEKSTATAAPERVDSVPAASKGR